jgi:hypothetical protein
LVSDFCRSVLNIAPEAEVRAPADGGEAEGILLEFRERQEGVDFLWQAKTLVDELGDVPNAEVERTRNSRARRSGRTSTQRASVASSRSTPPSAQRKIEILWLCGNGRTGPSDM